MGLPVSQVRFCVFAGVKMNFGAHLPPGTLATPLYEVFLPAKYQNLTWVAGKPVYQLVDPDGNVYVLQSKFLHRGENYAPAIFLSRSTHRFE